MPKQTCEKCKWFYNGKEKAKPNGCYWKGQWRKWLKLGSEDKPNDCKDYEE